jgi:2-dehydro-3-deoxyphosphogluconate aldolase/(4S)-4-hydroxy-2-oxoglutarate aldolase
MAAMEAGFTACKFFPAAQAGGVETLKALGGPFPQVRFCPTGGIDVASAPSYLALPNVLCVGGSWMAPRAAIEAGEFDKIEHLARAASRLRAAPPGAVKL